MLSGSLFPFQMYISHTWWPQAQILTNFLGTFYSLVYVYCLIPNTQMTWLQSYSSVLTRRTVDVHAGGCLTCLQRFAWLVEGLPKISVKLLRSWNISASGFFIHTFQTSTGQIFFAPFHDNFAPAQGKNWTNLSQYSDIWYPSDSHTHYPICDILRRG